MKNAVESLKEEIKRGEYEYEKQTGSTVHVSDEDGELVAKAKYHPWQSQQAGEDVWIVYDLVNNTDEWFYPAE